MYIYVYVYVYIYIYIYIYMCIYIYIYIYIEYYNLNILQWQRMEWQLTGGIFSLCVRQSVPILNLGFRIAQATNSRLLHPSMIVRGYCFTNVIHNFT